MSKKRYHDYRGSYGDRESFGNVGACKIWKGKDMPHEVYEEISRVLRDRTHGVLAIDALIGEGEKKKWKGNIANPPKAIKYVILRSDIEKKLYIEKIPYCCPLC
ncbi:hypothetical protein JTB14_009014 [Gonioctena quinquepunctata]|nr:hypothetical protein JTB14_009014 [Gonioctena quinquepunctata]